jgi:RNA binding exosome subunit
MRATKRTSNELRCFCSRHPLLATYGIDEHGKLYVHVKVFKQNRIFGEVLVTEGTVKLHCRECLRWHRVVMRPHGQAILEETLPDPSAAEV